MTALAIANRLAISRSGRVWLALAAVVVLLAGANVVLKFGPFGTGLVAGPLMAVVLVLVARRAGLTWDDLGLSRRTLRRGAIWAGIAVVVVAAVLLIGVALPGIRSAFLDVRYRVDIGSALVTSLLVVPIGTILLEEIAFRGVLFGLFRHRKNTTWAFGFSSVLFGLWHILPTGTSAEFSKIASVVGITALLGLLLCELRRRSGSLIAAVAGHWSANGLGVLLAALVWSWN